MCNPYLRQKAEETGESVCVILGNRVIVPPQGWTLVIAELHEAHPGISRMKAIIHGYVFWPNMDREIEDAVKRCRQCHEVSREGTIVATLKPIMVTHLNLSHMSVNKTRF